MHDRGGTIDVPTGGTTFTVTSNIAGAGGLTKSGGAKLTLTGANGYQGGTIVDSGTLLANNTTGSGTGSGGVTVNSGGIFGGTGSISGAVTVNAGGTLAPGASIESLDIGGLTLTSATSALALELEIDASPQADLLNVMGGVSPGGGGTCAPTVLKSWPTKPSGVQLANAIVPPPRQTRTISAAVRRWSGANIAPTTEMTASNARSGKGSAWASPSTVSTPRPSAAARARARSSREGT